MNDDLDADFNFLPLLFDDEKLDTILAEQHKVTLFDDEVNRKNIRYDVLNGDVPLFTTDTALLVLDTKMPHIAKIIRDNMSIGLEGLIIDRLINDNTRFSRAGFPKDVSAALLFLRSSRD